MSSVRRLALLREVVEVREAPLEMGGARRWVLDGGFSLIGGVDGRFVKELLPC